MQGRVFPNRRACQMPVVGDSKENLGSSESRAGGGFVVQQERIDEASKRHASNVS